MLLFQITSYDLLHDTDNFALILAATLFQPTRLHNLGSSQIRDKQPQGYKSNKIKGVDPLI